MTPLYTSHDGVRFTKREWPPQCTSLDEHSGTLKNPPCQGVQGHKGCHWCFDLAGFYCFWDNEDDPAPRPPEAEPDDTIGGEIPPWEEGYRTPIEMAKYHYKNCYTDSEVTDQAELARHQLLQKVFFGSDHD